MRAPAQLGGGHLRLLAGQVQEHVKAVGAEVAHAAAAGLGRIEHPGAIPGRIARRPRPVDADIDVRQRPETAGVDQVAGALGERRVALRQRHGDEGIEPRRLGRHRIDLGGADPHRLLHQERIAGIEQVVGDSRHLPVPPQRQDEVGAGRRQHLAVVGKSGRVSHLGRPFREDFGVGILDGDQFDVRHGQEVAQIGGVVERMPVADPDGGDADGHRNSPPLVFVGRLAPKAAPYKRTIAADAATNTCVVANARSFGSEA